MQCWCRRAVAYSRCSLGPLQPPLRNGLGLGYSYSCIHFEVFLTVRRPIFVHMFSLFTGGCQCCFNLAVPDRPS